MRSRHGIILGNANKLEKIADDSIELVVTSPPYPMIEMWDDIFSNQDPAIKVALAREDGNLAFELMHRVLDPVWAEVYRVLRPGGFACINIGDATRTVGKHFRLYANHVRILTYCLELGLTNLPAVIWRKQTNAPNKFMGSGMLPAGAYVTLEHELILILRKGNKREFRTPAEKLGRSQSALFWEERNTWFSDVWWDLKGAGQALGHGDARRRSGAFPFDLAYRLVSMYSVRGDTVLDPFLGTGTTVLVAMASNRNSIGVELERGLEKIILDLTTKNVVDKCNRLIRKRIQKHLEFVKERERLRGKRIFRYTNEYFGIPVMTRQEIKLRLNYLKNVKLLDNGVTVSYLDRPILGSH